MALFLPSPLPVTLIEQSFNGGLDERTCRDGARVVKRLTIKSHTPRNALAALFLLATSTLASAQPVDVPPTWGGSFRDRPRLTGSWFGLRDELGKKGVVLDVDLTQIPQGVITGGTDDVAKYGGLAEYTLNIDTQKLGLWPGGFFKIQGMTSFGQNVDKASGALVPVNVVSLLPEPGKENFTGLMDLSYMQFLSKYFGLVVGKLYTLGADDNAFAHDFRSTFLNTGFAFNMTLDLFPFTAYG